MTDVRAHRRRVFAGAGVALALLGGSLAAAEPLEHVPVYRYYVLARTDTAAHRISATIHYDFAHDDGFAVEWVMQMRNGRQDVFDRGMVFGIDTPNVTAAGHGTPGCAVGPACDTRDEDTHDVHVDIPVWFDYFIVTRDAVATADLSASPDRHWVFRELTGDARTTGRLHVRWPRDGDVTNVNAGRVQVQRIRDIGHPGGRYGSIATAIAPYDILGVGSTGSARLDGGRAYVQGLRRIEGSVDDVTGSHPGPTYWRLHGDLTTAGYGGGPTLLVYDLPDPNALRAFLRKRQ